VCIIIPTPFQHLSSANYNNCRLENRHLSLKLCWLQKADEWRHSINVHRGCHGRLQGTSDPTPGASVGIFMYSRSQGLAKAGQAHRACVKLKTQCGGSGNVRPAGVPGGGGGSASQDVIPTTFRPLTSNSSFFLPRENTAYSHTVRSKAADNPRGIPL
jgi:hypothetical protein